MRTCDSRVRFCANRVAISAVQQTSFMWGQLRYGSYDTAHEMALSTM